MRRNVISLSLFSLITGLRGQTLKLTRPMKARRTSSTLPFCLSLAEKLSRTSHYTCCRALHQLFNKTLGLHLMQLVLFMGTILFNSTWARTFLVITEISNNSSLLKIHHLKSRPTRIVITSKCLHF